MTEAAVVSPRRTKLRSPRIAGDVIPRPRLLERLNRLATLTLIVAPAGYGKTTLVSTWLAQLDLPSAWLSLEEGDDDPAQFLTYFVTAVQTIFGDFGGAILEHLSSPRLRPFAELGNQVVNELDELEQVFVLVINDFHWITSPKIHGFLTQLLTHPPRSIRLVITTRHDPPLPWSIRARSYLCELRARDLCFTQAETAEFLANFVETPVDAALAKVLTAETEGWIASLRLAALQVRRSPRPLQGNSLLNGSQHNIIDYFISEIIAYVPDYTRDFLVRTSFLNSLNAALCDYVLGDAQPEHRSETQLSQLVADGVFIVVLDDAGTWHRLHPLFRRALEHQLLETCTPAEIACLYERAVRWHEEQNLLEEAISYALAGHQLDLAVAVIHRHRQQVLDDMDFQRLDRWLRQFSPAAVAHHPDLLLTKAWLAQIRFETLDVRDCIEQAETLLASSAAEDPAVREWQGEIAALRSQLEMLAGDVHTALLSGKTALEATPRERFHVRNLALLTAASALVMSGESEFAESLLDRAAAEPYLPPDLAMLRVQQVRHFIQLFNADLFTMCAEFPKLLQLATARGLKMSQAWAHYFWGCACYLQNDLVEADEHFHAVLKLADYAHAGAYTQSAIGLALTREALRAPHEAAAIVVSAQAYLATMQLDQMLQVMNVFAAELAARMGQVEEVRHWYNLEGRSLRTDAFPMFYIPGLSAVKILLTLGADADLAEAELHLQRVMRMAMQTRNTYAKIQGLALQAALSSAQGHHAPAKAVLARSLALAEPGGVVRPYADLGAALTPLLEELPPDACTPAFLLQVRSAVLLRLKAAASVPAPEAAELSALGQTGRAPGMAKPLLLQAALAGSLADNYDLRQLLTYREMDVLRLLDQRLTNKEIARHLGISTETVRQHTVRLFRKLHVQNRRQAIVVARALGYSPD